MGLCLGWRESDCDWSLRSRYLSKLEAGKYCRLFVDVMIASKVMIKLNISNASDIVSNLS